MAAVGRAECEIAAAADAATAAPLGTAAIFFRLARALSLSLCGKRLRSSVAAARDTKHAPSVRHWAASLRPHRASLHTNPTSLRKHPLEEVAPATVSVNDDFIPFLPYNYSATPRAWIPVAMATEVKLRVRVGGK